MDGIGDREGPLRPADLDALGEDEWTGSDQERASATERFTIDPATLERVDVVEPGIPAGVARAWRPRPAEPRPRRPLMLGDRETDPLYIINKDDRVPYNDLRYPWGLVCLVENATGDSGSGVLVGPRHVLTASHVIDWHSDLDVTVEVHAHDRTARARAVADRVGRYTSVDPGDGFDKTDEDYAVLVLDRRLGDRFGWMGARMYDSGWDRDELWYSIGYARDVANMRRPIWQPKFYLDELAADYGWGRAMNTNADAVHGQSGSPAFAFWRKGPYVVAVIAAQLDGDNYCAGGLGLPSLVAGVRKAFP
jgi:V8-like Glu-specific endopeptidase